MTLARRPAVIAATCVVVVLAIAGCATSSSSTPSLPVVTPAAPAATAVPSRSPGVTSPAESAMPGPSLPPASSFPLVNSCDPSSVPWAIPVTAPASGRDSSFALQVPILMYHRIVPLAEAGDSLRGLVVPPETFAAQLDALGRAGWHTITMAALANDLQAHLRPPARTFVITIDDGWDDGYRYALPILQDHGFVATYYVIASRIDTPGFLSSAQLQALVAAGDEIGDHTMDHVSLARLPSARLTFEIDAAAARIAQVTGRWPESLAYPFGGLDHNAAAAVEACQELRIAVAEVVLVLDKPAASQTPGPTDMPLVSETWVNRFDVPRLRVNPDTTPADLLAELDRYQSAA